MCIASKTKTAFIVYSKQIHSPKYYHTNIYNINI